MGIEMTLKSTMNGHVEYLKSLLKGEIKEHLGGGEVIVPKMRKKRNKRDFVYTPGINSYFIEQ